MKCIYCKQWSLNPTKEFCIRANKETFKKAQICKWFEASQYFYCMRYSARILIEQCLRRNKIANNKNDKMKGCYSICKTCPEIKIIKKIFKRGNRKNKRRTVCLD